MHICTHNWIVFRYCKDSCTIQCSHYYKWRGLRVCNREFAYSHNRLSAKTGLGYRWQVRSNYLLGITASNHDNHASEPTADLDLNIDHSHFILVKGGGNEEESIIKFRKSFEKFLAKIVPVIYVLVAGDMKRIYRVLDAVSTGRPVIVVDDETVTSSLAHQVSHSFMVREWEKSFAKMTQWIDQLLENKFVHMIRISNII
jgi:hypothetical protein